MVLAEKDLNVATVNSLNAFIDNDKRREAEECVKYFKQFEEKPRRSRRRSEAYEGWPLVDKRQVAYVLARLTNVNVKKTGGIYLIQLIR